MPNYRTHAVIVAHPNPKSFTMSAARVYKEEVEHLGAKVVLRDLYGLNFDPCLNGGEIPSPDGFQPKGDVLAERGAIADADVFTFFYPLWLNVPPAMLVGYAQRVFGMGFGYGPQRDGENQRLLEGRALLSFSSSGAPTDWLRMEGGWDALRNLFDQHVAGVCGLRVLDHHHFGGVLHATPAMHIESYFQEVRDVVKRFFRPR